MGQKAHEKKPACGEEAGKMGVRKVSTEREKGN